MFAPKEHSQQTTAGSRNEAATAQTKAANPGSSVIPELVFETIRSPGQSLDTTTRAYFEQQFGCDFGHVRVHTDERAAQSARSVGAIAYNAGSNIAFDIGRFEPGTPAGRELLAHELAHIVQQPRTSDALPLGIGETNHPAELAAEAAVAQIRAGEGTPSLAPQPSRIYRQTPPTPPSPPTPAGGAPLGRVVQIDNNVIVEIGKGNTAVANALRNLCQTPGVTVQIDRGVFSAETTKVNTNVTAAEVAARKLLIEKLNIQVVDASMAARTNLYEKFAQDSGGGFAKHGAPGASGKVIKTLDDLPHVANAAARNAEIWSFDKGVQETANRLQLRIAPESNLPTVQNVPSSDANIRQLIPEMAAANVAKPDMTPSLRDLANPPPSLAQLQGRYATPAPAVPHDPDADLADQKQALKQRRDELTKALAAQKGDTVNVTAPLDSIFVETMGMLRPTSRKHVEDEVARLNEQIQGIDHQRQSQRAAAVAKELEQHVEAAQARRDHLDRALAASQGDEVHIEDPMDLMPGKVPMRRSRAEVLEERKKLEKEIDKAVANLETLRSSSAKPQDIARILIENGASVDHEGGVVQDGDQTTRWQVRGGALQIVQSTDARTGNVVAGKQAQRDEKRTIISPDGQETVVIDKKKSGRQWGTWVDDESHEIQIGGRRVGDSTQISMGPTGHSKTKTQWNFTNNKGDKDTRKRVLGLSDGFLGGGGEVRNSRGEHDADGKLTKGTEGYKKGSGGAVLGSRGIGLGGKGEAGGTYKWDPDKSISGKVGGGISFTVKAKYNMQAKCYEVLATLSIDLSAAGSGEAGAKRSMGPGLSKATGNLGVQGSFKRTLIRRLDAKELPQYMNQWSMISSTGTPGGAGYEFDLLRLGLAHGPEALMNMLKGSDVHAQGLGVEDEISGKVEAGAGGEHQRGDAPAKQAATIGAGIGFEAGMVLKRSIVPVVGNPKMLKCWFELSTERTFSGNLSGGFGHASMGVKGGITRGTTDTIAFQAPNRPEIAAELHALHTKDAIMAFLKSRDLRAATGHVDNAEDSFGPTAGVGPLSASLVTSILSANGTEVDEEGNTRYYTMGGMRDKGLLKLGDVELDSDVHEESYSARTGVDGQVSARAVVKESRSTALGSLKKKADDLGQNPLATVGDAISNPSKTLNKLLTSVTEDREQGMMLGTTEVEIIAARAKDSAKWYKFIENAKDKSDWIKLRKAIEAAEMGLDGMADYQKTFVRRKLINEAIAEFMKSSRRGRASMIWAVVRKDNIGEQKQLDSAEEWSAEAAGGAIGRGLMYELPDGLGSLADEIEAYVFKDVLAGPAKQIQAGDAAGAAAALGAIITTLQSLATKVTDAKDKFASTAQLGELLQAIRARQAKARAMFGQKLEDQMQTRYGELKSNCRSYLAQEQNVLGQLNESIADGHESTGDAATRIKRVNDLKLLHEVWGREYSELVRLATDLGLDPKDYEGLGPSKRMLQQAHDSKVADVYEQMEEDRRATDATRNNLEAGQRLMQSLAADPNSIAAVNARRLAEQEKAKAGVAGAQRARIAAARTKALMGAGKFNFAKKENRKINPAAEKKFGDGYTQIALAGQDGKDWEGLAGPSATMGGQPIPPDYLVRKAEAIIAKYAAAETLFKEGDALM